MEAVIASSKELDPRCFSALRHLGRCFQCKQFKNSRGIRCKAALVPREVQRYLDFMVIMEKEEDKFTQKWERLQEYELKNLEEKLQKQGGTDDECMDSE